MDFVKLKDSLFSGSSTNIEKVEEKLFLNYFIYFIKVEVNQRHLIDKILARYKTSGSSLVFLFRIIKDIQQNLQYTVN